MAKVAFFLRTRFSALRRPIGLDRLFFYQKETLETVSRNHWGLWRIVRVGGGVRVSLPRSHRNKRIVEWTGSDSLQCLRNYWFLSHRSTSYGSISKTIIWWACESRKLVRVSPFLNCIQGGWEYLETPLKIYKLYSK